MRIAIVYDTKTGTTSTAAEYIAEGIASVEGCEAACFNIADVDAGYVGSADGVVIGSPTYMASVTHGMLTWLQTAAPALGLAGKLGGAYATEQYIHGGAENVISTILTHELVFGMPVYSGGGSFGKPVVHLGPVGMSQNIADFKSLFVEFGRRFATQLTRMKG